VQKTTPNVDILNRGFQSNPCNTSENSTKVIGTKQAVEKMNTKKVIDTLTAMADQRGRAFKILIVDDEVWVREVFKDFCELTDVFDIDLASCGAEAIEKAATKKYDLITLDLIMPDVSGLEALDEIKRRTPQVPVMLISGNSTERLIHQAGVLGACKVLYKPVTIEKFFTEVASTLSRGDDTTRRTRP